MRSIFIMTLTLALISVSISSVWGQSAQQIGRYQVVHSHPLNAFLLDTATGRVWLFVPTGEKEAASLCRNDLGGCFREIDRLKWTDSGWASEIYPSKR